MPDDPEPLDPDRTEEMSECDSAKEASADTEVDGSETSNVSYMNKWSEMENGKKLAVFLATGLAFVCILYLLFVLFALWGLLNYPL